MQRIDIDVNPQVLLALAESKVPHTQVEIDLKERPSWYAKVNPAGKVCLRRASAYRVH